MSPQFLQCLHGKVLTFLMPFLKWASGKHAPWTHKGVTGKHYYKASEVLEPGDIFLTKIRGELTGLIIPGYWTHAAIYAPIAPGIVNEYVMEAEGPGVLQTDLVTFMLSKDALLILRPIQVPEHIREAAALLATRQLGMPYDYLMEFQLTEQKAFYCSELVWWAYATSCAEVREVCPFVPKMELGYETVSPDNIAAMGFHVVFDSRLK
jgi:hypothetical protein